jgi:hypothetical protein
MFWRIVLFTLLLIGAIVLAFALAGYFVDFLHVSLVGLLMVIGLLIIWLGALYDVWRRADLATGARIAWSAGILLLPVLGTLLYALVRPSAADVQYSGEQAPGTGR